MIEKKLVIDNMQAEKLKLIFDKYLELKSVLDLNNFLKENNIKTRMANYFSKGSLYHILDNKVYIGQIMHKNKVYEGEHQAIIDVETFEKVQNLLVENRIKKKSSITSKDPSLLAGKIFDDKDNYMSPSHSNKKGKRYRYYISQALLQSRKYEAGSVSKIPAGEIETVVTEEIKVFFSDTKNVQQYIENYDVHKQKDILQIVKEFKTDLKHKFDSVFIRTVLSKIILYKEKVEIILCKEQLVKSLEAITYDTLFPEELKDETKTPITITKEIRISTTSKNGSVLIISDYKKTEINLNSQLITAVTKSHYWNKLLLSGEVNSVRDINKMENLSGHKYIYKVIELRFLAPEIIERILNGTQPRDLSIQKLFNIKTLDWNEQKKLLNF